MRNGNMAADHLLPLTACVVKATIPHLKEDSSACGTVIDPSLGIIISHGSIFFEYAHSNNKFALSVQKGEYISSEDVEDMTFSILIDRQLNFPRFREHSENIMPIESSLITDQTALDYRNVSCKFLGAFRNNDFHSSVCRIMPESNWVLSTSETKTQSLEADTKLSQQLEKSKATNDMSYHLVSYFVVYKCEPLILDSCQEWQVIRKPVSIQKMAYQNCHIGQYAELISTPFGALCPSVFFNSYSRGVICNVSGRKNCWIITDARCIPGSEGGPLFVKNNLHDDTRFLCGIIASSLCWKNNEWIGFSVACSVESLYQSILDLAYLHFKPLSQNLTLQLSQDGFNSSSNSGQTLEDTLLARTVLVQVGAAWGSGVIVDRAQGIIITCSHVVKDAEYSKVLVTPYKGLSNYSANIIYRQKFVTGPYDIAVLKCLKAVAHLPADWSIDVCHPFIGQDVSVIGHAVFSPHLSLGPSWCNGVVSKINTHHSKPVLLQTTCAVHPGISGGPVFSSDGKLVAIVISNTKDTSSNTSFPHINMSVPSISFWPIMQHYFLTGDENILSSLVLNDPQVSRLWALGKATDENSTNTVKSKL